MVVDIEIGHGFCICYKVIRYSEVSQPFGHRLALLFGVGPHAMDNDNRTVGLELVHGLYGTRYWPTHLITRRYVSGVVEYTIKSQWQVGADLSYIPPFIRVHVPTSVAVFKWWCIKRLLERPTPRQASA